MYKHLAEFSLSIREYVGFQFTWFTDIQVNSTFVLFILCLTTLANFYLFEQILTILQIHVASSYQLCRESSYRRCNSNSRSFFSLQTESAVLTLHSKGSKVWSWQCGSRERASLWRVEKDQITPSWISAKGWIKYGGNGAIGG